MSYQGLHGRQGYGWRQAAVNDAGRVIGECHHSAKLTDADVDLILALRAAGMSYARIAEKFDDEVRVSRHTVASICLGRRRSQLVMGHRLVDAPEPTGVASPDEFEVCR